MGLAASQGRLLSLTSRNHDLVYEGQQISQQRLVLAEQTQAAAQKYNEAMNNKIMQATVNGETQLLTYDILTSQDPFTGMCMRLVDMNGNVVIPAECIEVQKTVKDEETGATSKATSGRYTQATDFVNAFMSDLSVADKETLGASSLANVCKYYNETYANRDENLTVFHRNKDNSDIVKDGEKVLIDKNIYDEQYLQKMLVMAEFKIQQAKPDGSFEDIVWQGSTMISEVYDTSDDAAAEAEYEATMMELQKRDKILELRLNQVETQQEAVHQEMESVKKIVDTNIEESFKTFA